MLVGKYVPLSKSYFHIFCTLKLVLLVNLSSFLLWAVHSGLLHCVAEPVLNAHIVDYLHDGTFCGGVVQTHPVEVTTDAVID